ncbi:MAG: hypothetical protein WBN75_05940, partial [Verrucomicrobiia bacterium]
MAKIHGMDCVRESIIDCMSRSSRQEVLWSANENLKKVIHRESASARDGFGALAFVRLYIWPVLV